jgi:molecular chaperone DnaK
MIHATKKSMDELGEKLEADEKNNIEAAIKDLEEVLKEDDKDAIEAKTQVLLDASGKMAERLYAEKSAEEGASAAGESAAQGEESAAKKEDVVDAEFEEVNDDKK